MADSLKQARSQRPRKPNWNQIHSQPLPLNTFPVPTLIPHNPLSLAQVLWTYVSQTIWPPKSHPPVPLTGYWSSATCSVHVTDPKIIRTLWEKGFFGKGSLSRSEPTWLEGEKRRQGLLAAETSEEITKKRRQARRQFKLERARKEREIIEQRLKNEAPANQTVNSMGVNNLEETEEKSNLNGNTDTTANHTAKAQNTRNSDIPSGRIEPQTPSQSIRIELINEEHLQLLPEEAFFLIFALGVFAITLPDSRAPLSLPTLLNIFRKSSYFSAENIASAALRPDDPFLLSYVSYHHFRSLGWVVRPGVKFGVDWLLYNRGPVFAHAEFAVVILPAYGRGWAEDEPRQAQESKNWWWLHGVNRVQSQVRKSLVLCYVEVPAPSKLAGKGFIGDEVVDVSNLLRQYRVREIGLKRWLPNRSK